MEILLRAALIAWLSADAQLSTNLNAVTEEAPSRSSLPWLAISASAAVDWSTKTETGEEIRIALELQCRGDQAGSAGDLVAAIQRSVLALPRHQAGFTVTSILFLRSRAEQRSESTRAILLEYRFRTQAA